VSAIHFLPFFLAGMLGSVHCIGMCGGIVSALSMTASARRAFPVTVTTAVPRTFGMPLAYNAGRIASYAVAGAIAGGVADGVKTLSGLASLQIVGYWLANLMLILLGLYLMGAWRGLARLEQAGGILWRRAQPLMRELLPMDTPAKALALGALWGWVPCGMVYSMLLTAMLSGSALSGAAVMSAFGLGTLPMLLALDTAGTQLRAWMQTRNVRIAAGMLVLLFGVIGLARAAGNLMPHWGDIFCITPAIEARP